MDEKEFLSHIANQFDEVEPEEITLEANFKDFEEWSSMHALLIIGMADKYYKVEITGDDLKNSEKLGDLYSLIQSRLSA